MIVLPSSVSKRLVKVVNLWVHDDRFSKHDMICNPDVLGISLGDLLEISKPGNSTPSSSKMGLGLQAIPDKSGTGDSIQDDRMVVQVTIIDRELLSKQPSLQISISQNLATLFGLQARSDVEIRKIDKESISATYIEIGFRDQYIGRSDMWRMKLALTNTAVYRGKKIQSLGIRGQIQDIIVNGQAVRCGYVTENTKTIFRSQTAKYFILLQMSKEMWEFDEDGELFCEKCVNGFLPELFSSWKNLGTNHVVSVVLFARILLDIPIDGQLPDTGPPMVFDTYGRPCRDFYKVVIDWETRQDWNQVLISLKREFLQFQREVLQHQDASGSTVIAGTLSTASEGNLLEAVNLALNPFDRHYVDRDLMRTGLSIVVVTPGVGLYQVDKKLARLTWQRMIDNGIGLDLVCLSKPPLHAVPLFQFQSRQPNQPYDLNDPFGPTAGAFGVSFSSRGWSRQSGTTARTYMTGEHDRDKKFSLLSSSVTKSDKSYDRVMSEMNSRRIPSSENKNDLWDPLYLDDERYPDSPLHTISTIPNWIECSFWSRPPPSGPFALRTSSRDHFVPRCKMYEVQMMGVAEQIGTIVGVPYLHTTTPLDHQFHKGHENANALDPGTPNLTQEDFDMYDQMVFQQLKSMNNTHASLGFSTDKSQSGRHDAELSGELISTPRLQPSSFSPDPFLNAKFIAGRDITDTFRHLDLDMLKTSNISEPMLLQGTHSGSEDRVFFHNIGSSNGYYNADPQFRRLKESASNSSLPISPNEDRDFEEGRHRHSRLLQGEETNDWTSEFSSSLKPISIRKTNKKAAGDFSDSVGPPIRSYTGMGSSPAPEYARLLRHSPGKGYAHLAPRHPVRQNYVNPCNSMKSMTRTSGQARRWEHLVPRHMMSADVLINWKSLCTPACLPLTTDFFPTTDELLELYQEYTYTVSPSEDNNPYQNDVIGQKVEALLIELISQRLAQGFQLIVPNNSKPNALTEPTGTLEQVPSTTSSIKMTKHSRGVARNSINQAQIYQPFFEFSVSTPYFLSLGDHVHRLFYDASGNNVEIKRYIRKIPYSTDPSNYACSIWPKHGIGYQPKGITFSYPPLSTYNWNYLDHLISGYQDEMTDALRFWRTRFLLIPAETAPQTSNLLNPGNEVLDEEEVRLAGFNKFVELFEKARWTSRQENVEAAPISSRNKSRRMVQIQHTTSYSSIFIQEQARGDFGYAPTSRMESGFSPSLYSPPLSNLLSTSIPLQSIATAMQSETGLSIKDRRWHVRIYEKVFIGEQCVDWLIRSFNDIETREDAIGFGNRLLDRGLIQHVHQKHRFLDGFYFYRIGKDYIIDRTSTKTKNTLLNHPTSSQSTGSSSHSSTWFTTGSRGSSKQFLETESTNGGNQISPNPLSPLPITASQDSQSDTPPFDLTKVIILDLDPQRKSNRREMALLHYDTVHNPRHCYHFQLHWLVCTPRLIDEMLQTWARMAEKCGLKLVEAPVNQAEALGDDNPFQSVIPIKLSVVPPLSQAPHISVSDTVGSLEKYYASELMKHFNFVLDVESDGSFAQYPVRHSFTRNPYRYTQFVHRSGMAFIQVLDELSGFYWVNNRLHLANPTITRPNASNGTNQSSSNAVNPNSGIPPNSSNMTLAPVEVLMNQFQSFCSDEVALAQFWQEATERLHSQRNPGATVES